MSHSFEQVKHGYANLWDKAKATNEAGAKAVAQKIIANRALLQPVEDTTDVPWWLVGCWLYRESSLDFSTYLGNGQSLQRVTTIVPAGRGPFQTFAAGAIDAIRYEHNQRGGGFYKIGKAAWVLEYCLWASEEWNGEGYYGTNVNSPYVWDWTNLYTTGLFTGDHHFSATTKENRAGVAAIMMALFELDPSLMPSRIAMEKPMTTTTTTTVAAAPSAINVGGIPIITILQDIDKAAGYLPILATFFPPLKVAIPFVPLIQGALQLAEDLSKGGQSPDQIVQIIVSHLQSIAQDIQALNAPATTTTTTQGSGG